MGTVSEEWKRQNGELLPVAEKVHAMCVACEFEPSRFEHLMRERLRRDSAFREEVLQWAIGALQEVAIDVDRDRIWSQVMSQPVEDQPEE
jgi:hypothetical protein